MSIRGLQPWIIDCTLKDNPGDPANPGDKQLFPENGGGVASFLHVDPILTNCLVVGNEAAGDGGGIFTEEGFCAQGVCGDITLINCTVVSNTADADNDGVGTGGGLYVGGNGSNVAADNCIFWDNSPDQINGFLAGTVINYSDVKDGWPGTGNINADPLFVNAPAGNLRLSLGSPAIDKGNPLESIIPCDFFNLDNDGDTCAPAPEEATPDLDLHDRVLGIVDMGAYEFIELDPCPCQDICPWDLNGDCVVGAADLLVLLTQWGGPGSADFDGDGNVGAEDLLVLLVNWGPCDCNLGAEVPTLEEEMADACLTMDDWDEFEDVMTDPESSQAKKDRYECWMTHYLFHCNRCFCSHPSECPSPDPFD